ncbi:hypothetical protein PICSAR138_04497 [Mycobacterium avium subsp. paratuberculosis]|nr:hypothetical protein PICSAR138_04497 [Mycobacterium avium subsp. paratuberculosis]
MYISQMARTFHEVLPYPSPMSNRSGTLISRMAVYRSAPEFISSAVRSCTARMASRIAVTSSAMRSAPSMGAK